MPVEVLLDHDLERLLRRWRAAAPPLDDPFAPEVIVIGAKGMDRWLRQQLAALDGIAANLELPFIEPAMRRLVDAVGGERPWALRTREADPWSPQRLKWRIAGWVRQHAAGGPAWSAPLRDAVVVAGDVDPVRLLAFAERVTGVLLVYMLHHPDALLSGELFASGSVDGAWQQALWQTLVDEVASAPDIEPWWKNAPPARLRLALDGLSGGGVSRDSLPPRITFFGFSWIPAPWLDMLVALGRETTVDVHLALWSPTQLMAEYFDLKTTDADALLISGPEPLFASCGRATVVMHQQLLQRSLEWEFDPPTDRPPQTLLEAVQQQTTTLGAAPPAAVEPDESLTFDACHTRLRELEVMRNRIAAAIAAGVAPHRIALMAPDVDAIAPLVEQVFGEPFFAGEADDDRQPLPCSIAERQPREAQPVVHAALTLLELRDGPLTQAQVLEALYVTDLAHTGVGSGASRFSAEEWAALPALLAEIGAWRGWETQDEAGHWTWREGLDRGLASGFVSDSRFPWIVHPPQQEARSLGVLRAARFERDALDRPWDLLARVEAFLDEVMALDLTPRPPADWLNALPSWFERLLHVPPHAGDAEDDLLALQRQLATLAEELADVEIPLDLAAMRRLISEALAERSPAWRFLRSGVTVCALKPLRGIPFDVICVVGLDDGVWPPADRAPSWQLATRPVRPRDESLSAFLELVLAARKRLHLSWCGREARSNDDLPPAMPVSMLLDAARRCLADGADAADLVRRQPLHRFDPANFLPVDAGDVGVRTPDAQPVGQLEDFYAAKRLRRLEQPAEPWRYWPEEIAGETGEAVRLRWVPGNHERPFRIDPSLIGRVLACEPQGVLRLREARLTRAEQPLPEFPPVTETPLTAGLHLGDLIEDLAQGIDDEHLREWILAGGWRCAHPFEDGRVDRLLRQAGGAVDYLRVWLGTGDLRGIRTWREQWSQGPASADGASGARRRRRAATAEGDSPPAVLWDIHCRWFVPGPPPRLAVVSGWRHKQKRFLQAWAIHVAASRTLDRVETLYAAPESDGKTGWTIEVFRPLESEEAEAYWQAIRNWVYTAAERPPLFDDGRLADWLKQPFARDSGELMGRKSKATVHLWQLDESRWLPGFLQLCTRRPPKATPKDAQMLHPDYAQLFVEAAEALQRVPIDQDETAIQEPAADLYRVWVLFRDIVLPAWRCADGYAEKCGLVSTEAEMT